KRARTGGTRTRSLLFTGQRERCGRERVCSDACASFAAPPTIGRLSLMDFDLCGSKLDVGTPWRAPDD
ncbi:MAG: hypothetical protein AAB250_10275, partial [Bdellovibrionota bacterium]